MNCRPTDSLRGICALLIVWHHFAPMRGFPYPYDFGNTIVLFFFVLSGYGITLSWKGRIAGNAREFLAGRCAKIFPIQWLTTLLYVLFGINLISWWAVPFHLTLTQSFMPLWEINFTLNTPSWFLSSILFCYLCTPFLLRWAERHRGMFMILLICAVTCFTVLVYVLSGIVGTRWLAYINPGARLLDYAIGMALGLFWKELKGIGGGTVAEFAFITLALMFMTHTDLFKFNNYDVLRYPVVIGLIATLSMGKGMVSQLLKNRWLGWLGRISMSVYMTHGFILYCTGLVTGNMPAWLDAILSYISIVFFSYAVDKALSYGSIYFHVMADKVFRVHRLS